jgi:Holliday junction resolvasome RuvABC DNA-binding subunit
MAEEISNRKIAGILERLADLLEAQDANPFRVRAYREAAQTLRRTQERVAMYVRQDKIDELTELPNIGDRIAGLIGEIVTTGRSALLDDLESQSSPEENLEKVPGIGPELAKRIVDQLHIGSLEQLEQAAHDGRLASLGGFGERRLEGIRAALAGMLSRSARRSQQARLTAYLNAQIQSENNSANDNEEDETQTPQRTQTHLNAETRPSVAVILAVDAQYRALAAKDELQKIAPRRFNPDNEAWLPIMRTEHDGWQFTAMFSNTAQAHQLEKTNDWVVIYYERDGRERQNTVVTETRGVLRRQRVVRGREIETRSYYKEQQQRDAEREAADAVDEDERVAATA